MSIKRLETKQRMSRAVIHNGTVYFCGQVAKDYDADITGQTRTTLEVWGATKPRCYQQRFILNQWMIFRQ